MMLRAADRQLFILSACLLFVSVQMMQQLYQECNLVHADLSEYNMLWHEGKVRPCLCLFCQFH